MDKIGISTAKPRLAQAWNGALVLAAAMVISKIIGVLQKIPLQNLAGDRVFGIYNAVYPLYQLMLAAATAGLPAAVAIVVARRAAVGDLEGVLHARRAALWVLGLSGAAGFAVLWLSAPLLAAAIGDADTANAFRSLAAALLVVPVLSALRGYSQGLGRMRASALSQLAEQTIRVAVMGAMLAAGIAYGWSDDGIASGAMAGSAAGAAAALLYMAWRQSREPGRALLYSDAPGKGKRREAAGSAADAARGSDADSSRRLLPEMKALGRLALPMAFGAAAVPMAAVVDVFTVPQLLGASGMSAAEAMAQFGWYGRGQTLVQLVSMVAGAAASAMMPALALARKQGQWREARQQAAFALQASWWIGAGAAAGLALLARPINVMLFADDHATGAFAIVGMTALAAAVQIAAAAVLQGCGRTRLPALLLLGGAAAKAALNAALVPAYGIAGAAAAGVIALTAAALAAAWSARAAIAEEPPGGADAAADGADAAAAQEAAAASEAAGAKRAAIAMEAAEADRWGGRGKAIALEREGICSRDAGNAGKHAREAGDAAAGEAAGVRDANAADAPARTAAAAMLAAAVRLGFALACMAAALALTERGVLALGAGLPPRAAAALHALTGVAVGACAFAAALLRSGGIGARQWRALPGGEQLAARLRRLRLIPSPQPQAHERRANSGAGTMRRND